MNRESTLDFYYVDSHLHLTEECIQDKILFLQKAQSQNIQFFLEAGVDLEGWKKQIAFRNSLSSEIQPNYFLALGLHPYKVAENSYEECQAQLDELAHLVRHSEVLAVGETGLDFREQFLHSEGLQIEIFEHQIEIAKMVKKPLVLHIVRAHEEALRVLELADLNKYYLNEKNKFNGQVHAFNGSFEVAQKYLDMNFLISIGGAVTYKKNRKLHEAVRKIPLNKLLIESDSPDQPPEGWSESLNNSTAVIQVAQAIAELKNISLEEVARVTSQNFLLFK